MAMVSSHHEGSHDECMAKAKQILQMAVPGDSVLAAVGTKKEGEGIRYTIAIETRRPGDLAAIACAALHQAMGMIEQHGEGRGGYPLGLLSSAALILEELIGESKAAATDA